VKSNTKIKWWKVITMKTHYVFYHQKHLIFSERWILAYIQRSNFSAMSWRKHFTFQWGDDDDDRLVLDKPTRLGGAF